MLPHQRSQRCQPSASLPSAPPTGSCSWGSVPQWLHLSLQITFKKLSLDSMPQAEMAGYPSKLQLGDKDPPTPGPYNPQAGSDILASSTQRIPASGTGQAGSCSLSPGQPGSPALCCFSPGCDPNSSPASCTPHRSHRPSAVSHALREKAGTGSAPARPSLTTGGGGVRGAGLPHHRAHQSTRAAPGWSRDGACCTPTQGSPPAGGATGWSCRTCRPTPGTPRTWTWATWSTLCPEHE